MSALNSVQRGLITRREVLSGISAGVLGAGLLPTGIVHAETSRVAAATARANGKHALAPGIRMAQKARKVLDGISDYSASFYKHELVGREVVIQQMDMKVRENPFSVYLRFRKPYDGREVIFVKGHNKGRLAVHGSGIESIIGTINLEPLSSRAMSENRYPITMIGMRNMLDTVITNWEAELGMKDIRVKYFPNAKVSNVECQVFESSHPQRVKGAKFHITRLYVGKDSGLPVRAESFGFPTKTGAKPHIVEQYTYLNVKKNMGLKSGDFDTSNEAYDF